MIMIDGWDGSMGMTNYTHLDRDGLKYQDMIMHCSAGIRIACLSLEEIVRFSPIPIRLIDYWWWVVPMDERGEIFSFPLSQ